MSVGVDGRWEPGIGDPTVVGWITVVAYGIAAVLSLRCARRTTVGLEHWFWVATTVALVLLGVNKQLDLQSLFTQTGRDIALQQGWYMQRRAVQGAFIAALVAFGIAALASMLFLLRRLDRTVGHAAIGMALLVLFVIIRGASFHHIDQFVGSSFEGVRFNWILELSPLVLISIAAVRRRRRLVPLHRTRTRTRTRRAR